MFPLTGSAYHAAGRYVSTVCLQFPHDPQANYLTLGSDSLTSKKLSTGTTSQERSFDLGHK